MPNQLVAYAYEAVYWRAVARFAGDLCAAVERGEVSPTMAAACVDYFRSQGPPKLSQAPFNP